MNATLEAQSANGQIIISFPESAVPPSERDDFITFLKTEWTARQSQFSAENATALAEQVDTQWWSSQRAKILAKIGEA
jgi:hypothetical protein